LTAFRFNFGLTLHAPIYIWSIGSLTVFLTPIPKGAELSVFARLAFPFFSRQRLVKKLAKTSTSPGSHHCPRSPSTMTANLLPSQIGYIEYMRQGKTAALTDGARQNDHASHAELNKLRALPCNSTCFDCTALKPGWAVLPHGVFICIDCAQTHRNMGRHVSQTKAINTGTYLWYPAELAVMREVGNTVAAAAFAEFNLPPKPSKDAKPAEKVAYSQAKYGRGSPDFVAAAARLRAATPAAPSLSKVSASPQIPTVKKTANPTAARLPSHDVDLINFEDVLPTPPSALSKAAVGKDEGMIELIEATGATSYPSEEELAKAKHEQKKVQILAHFDAAPPAAALPMMPLLALGQADHTFDSALKYSTKPKCGLARMKQERLLCERSKSHTQSLKAAEERQMAFFADFGL
jgi:hypothetical protein